MDPLLPGAGAGVLNTNQITVGERSTSDSDSDDDDDVQITSVYFRDLDDRDQFGAENSSGKLMKTNYRLNVDDEGEDSSEEEVNDVVSDDEISAKIPTHSFGSVSQVNELSDDDDDVDFSGDDEESVSQRDNQSVGEQGEAEDPSSKNESDLAVTHADDESDEDDNDFSVEIGRTTDEMIYGFHNNTSFTEQHQSSEEDESVDVESQREQGVDESEPEVDDEYSFNQSDVDVQQSPIVQQSPNVQQSPKVQQSPIVQQSPNVQQSQTSVKRKPIEIVMEVCGNDLDREWVQAQLRSQSHTTLIDSILNGEPTKKNRKSFNSTFNSFVDDLDDEGSTVAGCFKGNVYGADIGRIFRDAEFFDENDVDSVLREMKNGFNPVYRKKYTKKNRDELVTDLSTVEQLKYDFPFLHISSIETVVQLFNSWYAPSYIVLAMAQDQLMAKKNWGAMRNGKIKFTAQPITVCDQTFTNVQLRVLVSGKREMDTTVQIDPRLKRSIELVKLYPKCADAHERLMKERTEAQKDEIPLDCPICCDSVIMDNCVQCDGGHLVCLACLAGVVEEKVSGQCSTDLICLTSENGCELSYSDATLKRLSSKLYKRYTKRVRQEQLAIAYDKDDLEQCPGCGTQVEINVPSEVDRVLNCVVCKRQTCRICNEPWDEVHFGKKCIELEKDDETKKRKKYEEMMTNAAVRACYKCKQNIIKEEGCNKMTCRCGAKFCYLCRDENISDHHFCRHFIEEGTLCAEACGKCRLYEDPKTKDLEKLVEIQQKAKLEFGGDRIIGFDLSSNIVKKT